MKNVSKTNMQKNMAMQLQRFANIAPTTPGGQVADNSANLGMGVRQYRSQFVKILQAVYAKRSYFASFFNGLQTYDDISDNETVFTLKVNNTPVVNKRYNKDANVGMGTGTAKSSRFGDIEEIIYKSIAVGYTWDYGWHEGIDRKTVNMDENAAIADRSKAQAEFKVKMFNEAHGKFISENATALATVAVAAEPTQAEVVAAFNEAFKLYTDLEVVGTKRAYVVSDVWNVLVDSGLATNDAKAAGVNIANNAVYKFKDFILELIPESVKGNEADLTYFTVDGSAEAFTGIATARTIESTDFDGKAFQGAARAGEYILEDNKAAVRKFTTAPTP